jgi:hypothetical protein
MEMCSGTDQDDTWRYTSWTQIEKNDGLHLLERAVTPALLQQTGDTYPYSLALVPSAAGSRTDWEWRRDPTGRVGIDSTNHGFALLADFGGENTTPIFVDWGPPRAPETYWFLAEVPYAIGAVKLVNAFSGFCASQTRVGPIEKATVEYCNELGLNRHQTTEWMITMFNSTSVRLKSVADGSCLGPNGGRVEPGVSLVPTPCETGNVNQWTVKRLSDGSGFVELHSLQDNNLCLGVDGWDEHGVGARIELFYCYNTSMPFFKDQHWILM